MIKEVIPSEVNISEQTTPPSRTISIVFNPPVMTVDHMPADIQRYLEQQQHRGSTTVKLAFSDGHSFMYQLNKVHLEEIGLPTDANFRRLIIHTLDEARTPNPFIPAIGGLSTPLSSVLITARI